MQSYRGALQLPPVSHVLLDARRGSLSSHHHRLRLQRVTHPALVLRHPWMGWVSEFSNCQITDLVASWKWAHKCLCHYRGPFLCPCWLSVHVTQYRYQRNGNGLTSSILTACVSDDSIAFSVVAKFFFTVNTTTHEPLHVAGRNVERTCTLTTSRTALNVKVIGQGHMGLCVCVFVCTILLEPVGLDSRNVAQAWPAGST